MERSFDLAVVGGGIVGLACAYQASISGMRVVLFERSTRPMGATIRNFGMIWPIGQPAERMELVMRSRSAWMTLARATGMWIKTDGSIHVAYRDDEWQVLEEFVMDAKGKGYEVELLTAGQCLERSPNLVKEGLIGGMYSGTEVNIDPRQAITLLHNYLTTKLGVQIHYGTSIRAIEKNRIISGEQSWYADRVIIASGEDLTTLYPEWHEDPRLTHTKLQMMRTIPQKDSFKLGPNLAAGLTLLHYGSFSDCPGLPVLRQRVEREMGAYIQNGIHVMVSATCLNELTIGDSHAYGKDLSPFIHTNINDLILDYLKTFFLAPDMSIAETWFGVYTKTTDGNMFWKAEPEPGVILLNGLGGAGMTLSFGVAESLIQQF